MSNTYNDDKKTGVRIFFTPPYYLLIPSFQGAIKPKQIKFTFEDVEMDASDYEDIYMFLAEEYWLQFVDNDH